MIKVILRAQWNDSDKIYRILTSNHIQIIKSKTKYSDTTYHCLFEDYEEFEDILHTISLYGMRNVDVLKIKKYPVHKSLRYSSEGGKVHEPEMLSNLRKNH